MVINEIALHFLRKHIKEKKYLQVINRENMARQSLKNLKTKVIAHIETWRPYTVIWCGLLSLTGACLSNGGLPSFHIAVLSLCIPIIGWIAGLYLADYLDQGLDTIEKAHRPIPSKRMKPVEALIAGGIFVFIGIFLTSFLGFDQLLFIIIAGLLVFSYAKYTKSTGIIGNINRGFLAVVSYFFGVFAVTSNTLDIPEYVWFFAFVFFLHDITTNIVGTLRDVSGDSRAGYVTIPVKYGIKNSIITIISLIATWLIILVFIMLFYQLSNVFFYMMMFLEGSFIAIIIFLSLKLITNFSRKTALDIHKVFVLERITLTSALLFSIIDVYLSVFIFVISLFFTALFQFVLRNQYEFNKWEL